jgi:chromosome segregation protein
MRLDRLEISGFKSFSDRSELAFDKGVTAIVGPNGCGKSNVADAITWVLGEQSARSLRGDRMEDVIFSGSDARKAGGTAEVSLKLSGLPRARQLEDEAGLMATGEGGHDQEPTTLAPVEQAAVRQMVEEFTRDVEVTRRLYRSGESEYLIDGETCRLRDVHELLMDTGLGAKAYSIIEQGKIGLILSSRPTDRRQLIEEAAGVTKYKSRRRAAELKLDAAQQNLTRIDDIVFEVEKQRGALKRQAARARRYRKLREELRRWEKVLLARRYRELQQSIETALGKLTLVREEEAAAAGRVAEVEAALGRLRIEQAETDGRATTVREEAHAAEIDLNRRQQQMEFNRQHAQNLAHRASEIDNEVADIDARREPARIAIESRREAGTDALRARDGAAGVLAAATDALRAAQRQVETLEGELDEVRQAGFRVMNSTTTVRHAISHADAQREQVTARVARFDVEAADLRREQEGAGAEREAARESLTRAQQSLEDIAQMRAARESELTMAREALDQRSKAVRAREQELAAAEARLSSLEELAADRAGFGDAARMVLVQANGHVSQQGAVADFLEVDGRYERAVEACLGELLQHVIVERHDQAAAGLSLVREQKAGRCGFVVIDPGSNGYDPHAALSIPGLTPVSNLLRINGPHQLTIRKVLPEAYVAESFEQAVVVSRQTSAPVATVAGDVFRGSHLVTGGTTTEARGILQTKREIKELRERVEQDRQALVLLGEEVTAIQFTVTETASAIAALQAEQHRQEVAAVGFDAQLARAEETHVRLARKGESIDLERRQAAEEMSALDARVEEARSTLTHLEAEQQQADARLNDAQQRVFDARSEIDDLGRRAAEAGAAHAGLLERVTALDAEVRRLEESARELEARIAARKQEIEQVRARRTGLLDEVAQSERLLDDGVRSLDALRERVRAADDAAQVIRRQVDAQDGVIREARQALDSVRQRASSLEVARVTAEADLTHVAQSCLDAVQAPIEDVLTEVAALEASGEAEPDAAAINADEGDPDAEADDVATMGTAAAASAAVEAADAALAAALRNTVQQRSSMSAEEAISALKGKIDRLGPVNMMAIEQFDELETRHAFLTTQRQDLVDSIAQTSKAIRRIDETTKARFREAFTAIQQNFQVTFSTLFGGGHAGLSLLDENDPLESGIDIVASPPGKRLQNVMLLSGGEKALTAIALMFAIFRYKPSPFCLLDEIDAPLDDANVSRFVEMLRGMLDHTQFILITHNRRTMEIANRLYGVTMEEPGVSKLISVQLH